MGTLLLSRCYEDDPARRRSEDELAALATGAGHDVLVVPHLYHLAEMAAAWNRLAEIANDGRAVAVLAWMHPRPTEALLRRQNAWSERHRARDLASADGAQALWRTIVSDLDAPRDCGSLDRIEAATARRWYPLIEAAQCVNCQRCLRFCIFGVFALDGDGRVTVAKPDACKAGCPACSRICPHSAIMFPLYQRDPAIAGAPGRQVQVDAAARRMWFQRTGDACPSCGQSGKGRGTNGGAPCPHCGRPQAGVAAPADGLDGLIADLDRLDGARRNQGTMR